MYAVDSEAIEVFADIWCPFAHVGLRVVAGERRRRNRMDLPLIVRAWPLELVNSAPMNPERTTEHVAHLREQVSPDLFAGFDPAHFPSTTLPALALVVSAYRCGTQVGELMSFAVRDALFEEGRDISQTEVIHQLADRLSVPYPTADDDAAVVADWTEGRSRGVQGSPHFFIGAENKFCPSLSIERGGGHTTITLNRTDLTEFLDRTLGA